MSDINITVEGGTSKRLLTAGKYCDRDIVVTAEGGGDGGQVGEFTLYAKFIATPESTTSFVIENPLGGIAKKVFVKAVPELSSLVDIRKYIADYDLGIGVIELASTSAIRRYASVLVNGAANNGQFAITDGKITLYRFNSSNDWAITEYEIEIYQ